MNTMITKGNGSALIPPDSAAVTHTWNLLTMSLVLAMNHPSGVRYRVCHTINTYANRTLPP